jgi:2-iminobutanoate/2-iminopropanoate deaminase
MKFIQTDKAPGAIGPYSQAVVVNNTLFTSGQLGIDIKTGELGKSIEEQAEFSLRNLENIVKESGFLLHNIAKTTIFLKNIADFQIVNKIYADYFKDHKPARSTVEVASLPKNALIEIEAIAVK